MISNRNRLTLALSVALGLLAAPAFADNEDATTYQIDAAHDGHIDFAAGFNAPLVRAWTYTTSNGSLGYPVIGDGMLFFVANGNDAFGLDLASGTRVWEHLLSSSGNSPAYDGGTVVFATQSGAVTALKARTGKQRWAANLGSYNVEGYPIAVKGAFFVGGQSLTSLDAKTGAVNWSKSLDTESDSVEYGDDGLYAGSGCDFTKFTLKGDVTWAVSGDCSSYDDSAAYFDKRLYVSDYYDGNIILSSKDGSQTGFFPGESLPTFYTANNRDYELVTDNGKLYCLDVRTGNVVWSYQDNEITAQPIVVNGHPIVVNYSSIYMLDGTTGTVLWSDYVGTGINSMNAGNGVLAITAGSQVIVYKPQQ